MHRFSTLVLIILPSLWLAQVSANENEQGEGNQARLTRGVALYLAAQQNSLDAIAAIPPGYDNPASARLRGDLLAGYGLARAAVDTWRPALTRTTSSTERNELLLRLARLDLARDQVESARQHLQQMQQSTLAHADEKHFLLARIALARNHHGNAANLTEKISANSIWRAYMHYDLGIYLTENWEIGRKWLDRVNHMVRYSLDDPEYLALADQANLALARIYLDKRLPAEAGQYISRARKKGPTSNQSLLIAGWTWYRQNKPDKALAHWLMLRDRDRRDKASMEVLIAIPRAYEQLDNREVAAINYELAAAQYGELQREIDDAIEAIGGNALLDALSLNETTETALASGAPVFTYLIPEILSNDFQHEISQYRHLLEIQRDLESWRGRMPLLDRSIADQLSTIKLRKTRLQKYSRPGFLGGYQSRLAALRNELARIAGTARVRSLADDRDRKHLRLLDRIASSLERLNGKRNLDAERQKFRLLSGLVEFRLHNTFGRRLEEQTRGLDSIDTLLQQIERKAQNLPGRIATRQQTLARLRQRFANRTDSVDTALPQTESLLLQQGQRLNTLATAQLESRREHLNKLYLSARHSQVRILDELARTQRAEP